jgi:hypothetical protein
MLGNVAPMRFIRVTILALLLVQNAQAQFSSYRATWLISKTTISGNREILGMGFGKVLGYVVADGEYFAATWDVTTGEEMLLRPTRLRARIAIGFFGETYSFIGQTNYTLVGTTGLAVPLTPESPYNSSGITAAGGPYQIGSATIAGRSHAGYWKGTSASFVDLHDSSRFSSTHGRAVSYSVQAGYGVPLGGDGNIHALRWRDTPASTVDLHPPGRPDTAGKPPYSSTYATGAFGDQVVGVGGFFLGSNTNHALLWNGSAENHVNLHPVKASTSEARGVSEGVQVGRARFSGRTQAICGEAVPPRSRISTKPPSRTA